MACRCWPRWPSRARSSPTAHWARSWNRRPKQVKGGDSLSHALTAHTGFPKLAMQMVQVGEEAGQLDNMLLKAADTFDAEVKRAIDAAGGAGADLTIVMTVLVAVIMMAILLPLLSLTSNIH